MILTIIHIAALIFLGGNSFDQELKLYLEKQFSLYDGFSYEIIQSPKEVSALTVNEAEPLKVVENMVSVPVFYNKDGKQKATTVKLRLHLFQQVVTAVKKIKSREDLSPADFTLERQDITLFKGTPITSLSEVVNYKTKISLYPGKILTKEIVELKPVVLSGDLVKASITNGNVTISLEANARQDGAVGDVIRVVTQTKKQYRAKVMDSTNVNIIE